MADNDADKDLELEEPEDAPDIKEGEKDETDYKALAIKNAGIAKRNKTKLDKLKLKNAKDAGRKEGEQDEKNKGFDYGQKAFLKSNGIEKDEYELVKEVMSATGKDLEDVLESKHFQGMLKEQRDVKATKDATPAGSKRSTTSTRDTVEYWIAKGEMPPASEVELRRKVVNAKIKKDRDRNTFTDHPVV